MKLEIIFYRDKKECFMRAVRVIAWIARLALMATLVLGLLFWIAQMSLISFHALFGLIGVLSLLVLGLVAVSTRGIRLLGTLSMVYAFIVPAFGLTQSLILVGNLHWLIQTAHLLVGIGAMALVQGISTRYQRLKRAAPNAAEVQAPASQVAR
jgi:hypothetical protein